MEKVKNLSVKGGFSLDGTRVTATAAELNALAGQGVVAADAAKLHAITTSAAKLNNAGQAIGTVACDRTVKIATVTLSGGAIHAAVTNWQNPESSKILILRAIADITTKSTAASTLDVGLTEVSATTASDTLLDGIDTGTAAAIWDSNDDTDNGNNGVAKVQALASGKWVTFKEASGNTAAMVGTVYIHYVPA